jgi:NAD+ dependent glucose-6-phosphate dehydrogenase
MADKKKVLVTGLSGLVGTALRSEFEERYELSSLSRYGTDGMDDAHYFKGNIAELDTMMPAFEGQHTVVHLAADRSANANWESALRNNFVGVYNVYEAAKRAGVKRVVFGSSQHAIGGYYQDEPYKTILAGKLDQVERPFKLIDETVPIRPDGYYGASKAYAEGLGSYYAEYHGISSINIRIGWTISDDDPTCGGGGLAMWLSHRDTAQIHVKAVDAPDSLMYTVVFAMSNNTWNIFSLDKAREILGYEPQDDAGEVLNLDREMLERDDTDFKQHEEDPETY